VVENFLISSNSLSVTSILSIRSPVALVSEATVQCVEPLERTVRYVERFVRLPPLYNPIIAPI
jgi:hypothetical protein